MPTIDATTASCVMNGKNKDRVPVLSAYVWVDSVGIWATAETANAANGRMKERMMAADVVEQCKKSR